MAQQEVEADTGSEAAAGSSTTAEALFAAYAVGHLAMLAAVSDADALAAAGAALRKRRRALASQAESVSTPHQAVPDSDA